MPDLAEGDQRAGPGSAHAPSDVDEPPHLVGRSSRRRSTRSPVAVPASTTSRSSPARPAATAASELPARLAPSTSSTTDGANALTPCSTTRCRPTASTRAPRADSPAPAATTRSSARSSAPRLPTGVSSGSASSRAATTAACVGAAQPGHRGGRVLGRPALPQHHVGQRLPARPAGALEARRGRALVRPAEAQPAQGDDAVGQAEQLGQLLGPEQRDPAEPQPLGPGGQPEVLDRARARPHVGVRERRPPQHAGRRHPPVAADDDAERRLADALELQVEQAPAGVRLELRRLPEPLAVGEHAPPAHGSAGQPPRGTATAGSARRSAPGARRSARRSSRSSGTGSGR